MGLVGWRGAVTTSHQSVASAEERLAGAVRLSALGIDALVMRHLDIARTLAELPAVRAAARGGSTGPAAEALVRALGNRPGAIASLCLIDTSGRVIVQAGDAPSPDRAGAPADWQRALTAVAPSVTATGDSVGLPTDLVFLAAVRDDAGRPIGLMHLRTPASMVRSHLRDAAVFGESGVLVRLRARDGRPLASFPPARAGGLKPTAVAWEAVPRAFNVDSIRADAAGVRIRRLRHADAGYRLFEAGLPLMSAPWYLVASVDDQRVLATARQRVRSLGIELAIVAGLVSLVALSLGARLSRRVIALRDVTQRFAGGDREARASIDGQDEVTDLARSVNAMAAEIATLVRSLQQRTAELEHDIAERERLEAQLVQARKLEAIGQLAGGIAHDYNNTLTVILQCAEAIAEDAGAGSPHDEDLKSLRAAAERAADLTRQLLTFARKQTVEPRDLDLNAAVRDSASLLRGVMAGRHRLEILEAATPLPVRMDPTQVTQVLLNLAANARDAFGDVGGTLRLRLSLGAGDGTAAQLQPTHAILEAIDSGCGMDAETVSRIFEPFFTTKAPGRGTGLGLATVFGIISQAGGTIAVESAPGHGTTFRIAIPLRDAATRAA
mgnify:CR=1 FL=1